MSVGPQADSEPLGTLTVEAAAGDGEPGIAENRLLRVAAGAAAGGITAALVIPSGGVGAALSR